MSKESLNGASSSSSESVIEAAGSSSATSMAASRKDAGGHASGGDDVQVLASHEQIPRLVRPRGEMARSLPSWDPEPPAFLIKRGEVS